MRCLLPEVNNMDNTTLTNNDDNGALAPLHQHASHVITAASERETDIGLEQTVPLAQQVEFRCHEKSDYEPKIHLEQIAVDEAAVST